LETQERAGRGNFFFFLQHLIETDAACEALKIGPNEHAVYVLLANLYASVGLYARQQEVWQYMEQQGIKKNPRDVYGRC